MVNYEDPSDKHKKKLKIRKVDPTLRWYVNGKATPYKGGEKMEDLILHILKETDFLYRKFSCDQIKKAPAVPNYALNMMYVGEIDKKIELYNSFIKTHTNTLEPYLYGVTGPECAEHYGITAPGIVILRNFD